MEEYEKIGKLSEEIVKEIVEGLRRELDDKLISVFLMGSAAAGKVNPLLQDLDFIIVVRSDIKVNELKKVAEIAERVSSKYRSEDLAVNWYTKDGPWKPKIQAKNNIGIHLNLQNPLQIYRRAAHQTNLAHTMFLKSKLLYGTPPTEIWNISRITPKIMMENQYAVPWLKKLIINTLFSFGFEAPDEFLFEILQYSVLSASLSYLMIQGLIPEDREETAEKFNEIYRGKYASFPKEIYEKKDKMEYKVSKETFDKALEFLDELMKEVGKYA
ncbi:MAG: hypothetical protein ACE5K4_02475 [Candidatus Hydrothermarchaeota archaeon]